MTETHFNNEEALLHQMVETIVREVAPETIILFGSRARGDARPDSDVDLLVVETEPFSPQRSRRKEAARLYMALRELVITKVPLIMSSSCTSGVTAYEDEHTGAQRRIYGNGRFDWASD